MSDIKTDFTHKPDDASLENRGEMGSPSFGGGKTKSVWQGFVDASGFKKRHAKMMVKRDRRKNGKY